LNFEKELKSSVGKKIPTVYYSLTKEIGKEIGMCAVCGLELEELEFMSTSVGLLIAVKISRSSVLRSIKPKTIL